MLPPLWSRLLSQSLRYSPNSALPVLFPAVLLCVFVMPQISRLNTSVFSLCSRAEQREGTLSRHQRPLRMVLCVCVVGTGVDVRWVFESVTADFPPPPTRLKIPSYGPLTYGTKKKVVTHLDWESAAPQGGNVQRSECMGGRGVIAAVFGFRDSLIE